jgi:hypothetical protein
MEKATYRKSDSAHTVYKNKDGVRLPGVSTIVGVLAKPQLIPWSNRLGLEGIDVGKYVDALANAGTLAHYLVQCDLEGEKPDQKYLDEFSKIDMDRAETGYLKFLDWRSKHHIEVVATELQLVSEEHQFGGTLDILAKVDGVLKLVDLKTCKAIYGASDDKFTQCAGYDIMAVENGYDVQGVNILRIGRDETEGFEDAPCLSRELHRKRFLLCRSLYAVNAELKKIGG